MKKRRVTVVALFIWEKVKRYTGFPETIGGVKWIFKP
jgi:hypothetical protein